MHVRPVELPPNSALHQIIQPGDFVDCYYSDAVPAEISATQAAMRAMSLMPKWARGLLKVRNFIVSFYGLKTGGDMSLLAMDNEKLVVGDYVGVFRVQSVTENEILIGEDDKHLNFLISILRHERGFTLATWVQTHNWFGRIYLWTIMPFHKLIVRDAAKRMSHPS